MEDSSRPDKRIEKLIGNRLRAQLEAGGADCPEAETLAAFVEKTLARGERESLQLHLAGCARCQEQVAELVRLSEAAEPERVRALAPVPTRKIAWFRWALAAPALVALVVAGLWYTGEFRPLLKQQPQPALQAPPPPATQPLPAGPKEEFARTAPAVRQKIAEAAPAEKPKGETVVREAPVGAQLYTATPTATAAGEAGGGAKEAQPANAAPPAIASPSARARLAAAAPAVIPGHKATSTAYQDHAVSHLEVPAAPAAAPPPTEREKGAERAAEAAGTTPTNEATAFHLVGRARLAKKAVAGARPEGWRVGRGGLIQKADANGMWVTQPSGVDTNLLDIAFPTPSVGWVVGESGTVLRTTDGGATWQPISIPTRADLVLVVASGELSAQVVTRDGRTFATTDGGKSWNTTPRD
jgi:hypothetical protein